MALDGELDDLSLGNDGASDAVSQPAVQSEPETVHSALRDAFERAKETAAAGDDPEKLEAIRVRRGKEGRFEKGEGNDTRDATGAVRKAPEAQETPDPDKSQAARTDAVARDPLPGETLSLRPPPGWNAQARADYAKLPLHVQQAVAMREQEVNQGFAKLAEFKGIEAHLPRIKASNLTPAQFVDNAVKWEDSLKANPEHTVMQAIKLGGIDPLRLSAKILQQAGYQIGPRSPAAAGSRPAPAPQVNVQQLVQREFQQREQAAAQQKAAGEAEAFLSDPKNVHAEAVVDDMVALISQGRAKDLPSAYEMAIWAKPDIRALLIKQQGSQPSNGTQRRAVVQARSASKATVGAPSGLSPAQRASAPPKTVRDAVRLAYAQAQDAD